MNYQCGLFVVNYQCGICYHLPMHNVLSIINAECMTNYNAELVINYQCRICCQLLMRNLLSVTNAEFVANINAELMTNYECSAKLLLGVVAANVTDKTE